jgi:Arc/MetJ-type ribon-helix-helix transcriptional regulator
LQLLALVALMPTPMKNPTSKISISLPADLNEWLEKHSRSYGFRVPKSQIITKALNDMRAKKSARK